METSLQGRVAVVTGGASGIGEACVRELAACGARVVVADIDEARANAVAGSIEGAMAARLDVTSSDETRALADRVERELGLVDILITSAGVLQRPLPPEDAPEGDWDRVIGVDQTGVYVSCVAFGTRMARRGSGAIVNIASVAGFRPLPMHAYSAAKAAVVSLTTSLAVEWGRSGVRVNAVAPGFVLTPALRVMVERGERDISKMAEVSALGRVVEAADIARACRFLASDDAAAITGITLPVDAGWMATAAWPAYGGVRAAR